MISNHGNELLPELFLFQEVNAAMRNSRRGRAQKVADVGVMVSTSEAILAKLPQNGSPPADFLFFRARPPRSPFLFVKGEGRLEFTAVAKHLLDPAVVRCRVFVLADVI